jgi:hypothetical protein
LAGKMVEEAVSSFGASVKPKLSNVAISGAPEDQLRGTLDVLFRTLAEIAGLLAQLSSPCRRDHPIRPQNAT